MPPSLNELGLDRLSREDRLAVAHALIDSIALDSEHDDDGELELTPELRAELERRLADSIARPEAGTPWEVVRQRALARVRS